MTISPEGRRMVEDFEGVRLTAYKDGRGIPTIGVGHTQGVQMGDIITFDQADKLLSGDLKTAENAVNHLVKVPLTQNQFDALVSLTFNIGQGNFSMSTVLRKLNMGDNPAAADAFLMWKKIAGEDSPGLLNRRTAERTVFLEA